jgi:hypothetical protein
MPRVTSLCEPIKVSRQALLAPQSLCDGRYKACVMWGACGSKRTAAVERSTQAVPGRAADNTQQHAARLQSPQKSNHTWNSSQPYSA